MISATTQSRSTDHLLAEAMLRDPIPPQAKAGAPALDPDARSRQLAEERARDEAALSTESFKRA